MDIGNIEPYLKVLALIATAIPFILLIWKRGFCPIASAIREVVEVFGLVRDIAEITLPNGGSSIVDKIDSISETLHIQQQRYKLLVHDLDIPLSETNAEGLCIWANIAHGRLTGRSPEELLGTNWINAVYKADRKPLMDGWMEAVKYGREFQFDYTIIHTDGTEIPVSARTFPIFDTKGKINTHMVIIHVKPEGYEAYSRIFGRQSMLAAALK